MSLIDLIFGRKSPQDETPQARDASKYAFVDVEVSLRDHKVHDIGALRHDGATFHGTDQCDLANFLAGIDYVCGHNIVHHDARYLDTSSPAYQMGRKRNATPKSDTPWLWVDTLYLSPLLFPEQPYHRLVKDDKLLTDQINNPVNDCEKARQLLFDEMARWRGLPERLQAIYAGLLGDKPEFCGFMRMTGALPPGTDSLQLASLIFTEFEGRICSHADVGSLIAKSPVALAYALALVGTGDRHSVTPGWVLHHYPEVEHIIYQLRHVACGPGCSYCNQAHDARLHLRQLFGYHAFRTYDGEPLQERAVQAAVSGRSLLAVFPTGGGKSLTFQLPALMDGDACHGLTVVVSPLQSLMKDQVDNLGNRGITDAVTINGLLNPIERADAIERVASGEASLLYIAPEMLRSKTIERILLARHVMRFVIDEAHCFSAWGQDFRVDYLYIGKFIRTYQEQKGNREQIRVSCFTATAKQKVIQDIRDYFKHWLGIELELFASKATRTNLRYSVIHVDTDEDKYVRLRSLVTEANCPTIIYVSRTKRSRQLAERLTRDGLPALPYYGKMSADEKTQNQDAFMGGKTDIIVATSAFGMGVDKSDVGLVVHYDISDSLENYVQEAGRAGRDPHIHAHCYVLYGDNDLDKHFILLNQTKLSISEIQQVWRAIKDFTKARPRVCCSALEIARRAGWDDSVSDIETRVRTAIATLEQSGYVERGNNVPHVYATGITVNNLDEARKRLDRSPLFSDDETEEAVRIIKSLISQKHTAKARNAEAESRIDYLADILGLSKQTVISVVERMRQDGILADSRDMSAHLRDLGANERKSQTTLERFGKLERYVIEHIPDESVCLSYKQLNDNAIKDGISTATEKNIRTLLYFLMVKGYTRKTKSGVQNIVIRRSSSLETALRRYERRMAICQFAISWLYQLAKQQETNTPVTCGGEKGAEAKDGNVQFSVVELVNEMRHKGLQLFGLTDDVTIEEVEEALLYLSKIGALKLEGGFLVLYNAMDIRRLKDSRLRYKQDDYRMLNEFYKQKIQQIHIVGEYANLMVRDYNAALQFVKDYFQMDYQQFMKTYFQGEREQEIERNITPAHYRKLFGTLSERQMEIISDKKSRCIVVAAGPGSGKTRVLVHKLASMLLLEDVKHEQLLMLTFSRAAATEFKQRLIRLIGNAAHFVEIKTFHSYCFDLLGRLGNIEDADHVVGTAAHMIAQGEVEANKIKKTVLVIDEAQDMDADDYALVLALMEANDDMRVIAVGDDDQNIYEFRGSDARYMRLLGSLPGARLIEMTDNYRSAASIVEAANDWAKLLGHRIKKTPLRAVRQENGQLKVVFHTKVTCADNAEEHKPCALYIPILEDVKQRGKGSTCVLTQTNKEAAVMVTLLNNQGISSKLIQSMSGLRFCNVAETRYFLKYLTQRQKAPIIPDELWNEAKEHTSAKYKASLALPYLKRCWQLFEQTNPAKYYNDFWDFIFESSVEDFCAAADDEVIVSTIHKAKGREFDHVFLLINEPERITESVVRHLYVGITRAKDSLVIHTDSPLFRHMHATESLQDTTPYDLPDEMVFQLTHRDVYLDFFKDHKQQILALQSGDRLSYRNHYLFTATNNAVAKLSKDMQKRLQEWENRGYRANFATIRFIVAWKPKDAPKQEPETAVLLVDLHATRLKAPTFSP